MSGELRPIELEPPELTILRSETQKLHDDIAAACLVGDPRLNTSCEVSVNTPSEGVSITARQTKLIYSRWNILEQNGVLCLEEETQRPSRMSDAGYAVREITTYPLRTGDFVTHVRRMGYPMERAGEWLDTEEPTIEVGDPVDGKFQNLFKILEGLRSEVFTVRAMPQCQNTAGGLVAHVLARFHRHAA